MKKKGYLLLSVLLLLAVLPGTAWAADSGTCGENVTWSYSDGTLTISGTGPMEEFGSVIGSTPWYDYHEEIKTVIIGDGVTSIGSQAFSDCRKLTSATIPDSVTSIGNWAFSFCNELTSVTIPNSVISIGGRAFHDCRKMTSVTIPEGIARITQGTFLDCNSLTSITIPSSVTSIEMEAFDYCNSLTDVYYGGSESQWKQIKICYNYGLNANEYDPDYAITNTRLINATIHYSSGTGSTIPTPTTSGFGDVQSTAYYYDSVKWAVAQGITTGTSATTFSPEQTCTRAQILTFLWRAAGSPEPKGTASFSDIDSNAYYAKAAAWAAEQGMVTGNTFAADSPCTRLEAVEYMWRYDGSSSSPAAGFADVKSPAVDWAVNEGVTNGTGATTFSPEQTCTRAQIVTFLYRAFV